ncbi:hematopoietic prostaglandin D synthase-like isoform X2 [Homarus americanus]|uniref:hematopoietic prostaglandin D synthase-like isoform X2 n=1 Tax=Homarus americanus TaxID=6706 RepID=UPI001C494711|nr:hematopoietic prostaglandin D synthase-like isoform X2 [Homarus americanus]XP_042204682.1 hematopoietic prostaglandin D synthase-like isoform X2 [Homarus americanus]
MPQYKLMYFNLRGRGEPVRWVLAAADQPYEDVRFSRETEWPFKKPEMPYGKVPVLYVDEKPLSQSVAICRYLGRMHGLAVEDPWEVAKGDEVADAVHDLLPHAAQMVYAKLAGDVEKAKMLATEFYTSTLPPVMRELDRRLEGRDWFCGDKMTWVDVFAACYLSQLSSHHEASLEAVPRLKILVEKVIKLPQIEKWIKERPDTPM